MSPRGRANQLWPLLPALASSGHTLQAGPGPTMDIHCHQSLVSFSHQPHRAAKPTVCQVTSWIWCFQSKGENKRQHLQTRRRSRARICIFNAKG